MSEHALDLEQLAKVRDGSGHSVFAPSSSDMIIECSGSLVANLVLPDNAGYDAAWGTVAHMVAEQWRRHGRRPDQLRGVEYKVRDFDIVVDDEMIAAAQENVDWTDWLPGEHFIEQKVDISRITPIPNQSGHADFIAHMGDTMLVHDDKYGKGVRVDAENNPQGMLYALGSIWRFDPDEKVKKIVIRIGQPRMSHFDEWEVSRDDLMMFAGYAKHRFALAWRLNAPRKAGEHCRFCRARPDCPAYAKELVDLTEGHWDNEEIDQAQMQAFAERLTDDFSVDPIAITRLTTEQMVVAYRHRGITERWFKALEVELLKRTQRGEVKAMKIVEARSRRAFVDETTAVAALEAAGIERGALYTSSMISPAKTESLLRAVGVRGKQLKGVIEPLTYKPPGKPTLAPLSDKRTALVDLSEAFLDHDEGDEDDDDGE